MPSFQDLLPDDILHFNARHVPVLTDGTYEITASHKLETRADAYAASLVTFVVSGVRLALVEADVASVYPPSGATGSFDTSLPSIILKSDTLPWERSPDAEGSRGVRPWLALLVLQEDEPVVQTTRKWTPDVRAALGGLPAQPGESGSEVVTVIDVPAPLLRQLLPSADELALSAHVRAVTRRGIEMGAQSVVVANRFPAAGKLATVHLVSLEGRFDATGLRASADTVVSLISLYRWSFTAESSLHSHFEASLAKVNASQGAGASAAGGLELRWPSAGLPKTAAGIAAARFIDSGFVPLRHRFRSGERSVSWYRGPLVPLALAGSAGPRPAMLTLPAMASDQLLLCDQATGMFDCSYAAAWEIGRLLMLRNTPLAVRLHEWKLARRRTRVPAGPDAARAAAMSHLPLRLDDATHSVSEDAVVDALKQWIHDELLSLAALPFRYLVADDGLLPVESLRFFGVDRFWLECLVDGAFSVARGTARDLSLDSELMDQVVQGHLRLDGTRAPPLTFPGSGFLLRSAVVADFPGLQLEAFAGPGPALPGRGAVAAGGADATALAPWRSALLSPTVRLALYEARSLGTLDCQLPAEALHFGLEATAPLRQPADLRVLNLGRFAGTRSIEEVAMALIAKRPKVRFTRENTA